MGTKAPCLGSHSPTELLGLRSTGSAIWPLLSSEPGPGSGRAAPMGAKRRYFCIRRIQHRLKSKNESDPRVDAQRWNIRTTVLNRHRPISTASTVGASRGMGIFCVKKMALVHALRRGRTLRTAGATIRTTQLRQSPRKFHFALDSFPKRDASWSSAHRTYAISAQH
jgi:hypothetical protein